MRRLLARLALNAWLTLALALPAAAADLPKVKSGRLENIESFASVNAPARTVLVWLPDDYRADGDERYGVLYMHDGQALFDATSTWNRQAWDIDEVLGRLMAQGRVRKTLVVGIWNLGAQRSREFTPMPAFTGAPADEQARFARQLGGAPTSDAYLKFLVEELKPYIDKTYRTLPGREHTVVMGSSMGGLMSLYALTRYPEVFGAAACMSTHWPVSTDRAWAEAHGGAANPLAAAFRRYLELHLPDPATHKIYFDHGTEGLDALYPPLQALVDQVMTERGYRQPVSWLSRSFPGADHDETSWHRRLDAPLAFVLR
ncbi:MAG TPA: alpha/beta fold hydrolase [Roseateles sp.]